MSAQPSETFLTVPFGLGLEVTMRMGFRLSHTRLNSGNASSSGWAPSLKGRTISRHQQLTAATVRACKRASGYTLMSNNGYPNF